VYVLGLFCQCRHPITPTLCDQYHNFPPLTLHCLHSLISLPKVGFTMSACGAKAAPPLGEQVLPNNFPPVPDGPAAEDVYNEFFPPSPRTQHPNATSPLCPPTAGQRTHSEPLSCHLPTSGSRPPSAPAPSSAPSLHRWAFCTAASP